MVQANDFDKIVCFHSAPTTPFLKTSSAGALPSVQIELRTQGHTCPKSCLLTKPRVWTLTYVTVVARPASNAVTVVAANQVPAGVGINTGLALTFIGIWKTKGNIQGGREKPTPQQ